MAKVDVPRFCTEGSYSGEVSGCDQCPLSRPGIEACAEWWNRNSKKPDDDDKYGTVCPTKDTYEEACRFAEQHPYTLS